MAALLFCMPPLTWTAMGLLAGWLAVRRGKSWRWGFALGFCFSTAGVVLAALPRRISQAQDRQGEESGPGEGNAGVPARLAIRRPGRACRG
ncbi:MAG TPA: hypothetical protein VFF52_23290 [Isosphaeraceae bacterium]|nr:hypothetical protein [Isosphaeraceae bacterium]